VVTVSFENELDRRHFPRGFEAPAGDSSRLFRLTPGMRIAAALRHPLLPLAASARRFAAGAFVAELLEKQKFDRIDVEFSQAAEALPRRYWPRTTVVCHDILSQLYRRRYEHSKGIRKALMRAELARVEQWERSVLRRFGKVTVLNEKDRELVETIAQRSDVAVRYPAVPAYVAPDHRTSVDPNLMLFWGHMARPENADAVVYFVQRIMPYILRDLPHCRLVVAGIDPPERVKALENRSVTVTGYVEDPAPLFRFAAIGVVPMRLGAGIKIKTVEMIASGLPVVATSVGAEGVAASDLLIVRDGEREFAQAVIDVCRRQASAVPGMEECAAGE
jgi:glycosyltransferase involved in cell wall biosynthesis